MMSKEFKVCKEAAEQEFERFADTMDLNVDTSSMDEDDLKGFNQQKDLVVLAIAKGSLVISDSGEPVFTPARSSNKTPITFHEPTGSTLMAMDRRKKGEEIGKVYSAMADMTRVDAKVFAQMSISDVKVCTALFTLFVG